MLATAVYLGPSSSSATKYDVASSLNAIPFLPLQALHTQTPWNQDELQQATPLPRLHFVETCAALKLLATPTLQATCEMQATLQATIIADARRLGPRQTIV